MCCTLLFFENLFFQVQGLPIGNLTIAEKSLLSDALYSTSRNKIRALIELSEVIVKALLRSRNTLTSKDAIEICKKIQEVYISEIISIFILIRYASKTCMKVL